MRPLYGAVPPHDVILVAVRRRRNGLLPINKLPVEARALRSPNPTPILILFQVLSTIFRLYTFALHNDEERTLSHPALVVCAHWRAVALNDCMLWRRLAISSAAAHLADLILDRAKRGPVCLELSLMDPDIPERSASVQVCEAAGKAVANHLDHIHTLVVAFGHAQGPPFLRQLYFVPAPKLERLGLHYDQPDSVTGYEIPPYLFNKFVPSLRTLHLENVLPNNQHHFLLSSTPTLHEICASGSVPGRPLSARGLCALFQCRSATTITLRNCSFAETSDRDAEMQLHAVKITIGALHTLTLDSVDSLAALHVLGRLPLSKITAVHLRIRWPDGRLPALSNAVLRSIDEPTYLSARGDRLDAHVELRDDMGFVRSLAVHVQDDERHPRWATYWPAMSTILRNVRTSVQHLWVGVDLWPGVIHALSGSHGTLPTATPGSPQTVPAPPLNQPPLTLVELTLELAATDVSAVQTLGSFEPALMRGATLRAPALHTVNIVARPGASAALAGFLLDTFLRHNVKYMAPKLGSLMLSNVVVDTGEFWDAVKRRVERVVVVDIPISVPAAV